MARDAGYGSVAAGQGKRSRVVVESGWRPRGCRVTGLASLAEIVGRVVRISGRQEIRLMARDAGSRRVLIARSMA